MKEYPAKSGRSVPSKAIAELPNPAIRLITKERMIMIKMTGISGKKILALVLIITGALFVQKPVSEAQETDDIRTLSDTVDGVRLRLEGSVFWGMGIDEIDIGKTDSGKTVSISGGGGPGGAFTAGYVLSREFDIDVSAGFQSGDLSEDVSNADGSFERKFLLATLKYKIPLSDTGQIKIGAGVGMYMSGELDVDTSEISGGFHTITKYDDAVGFHVIAEHEKLFPSGWAWGIGIKYYNVNYDADSATLNKITVPTDFLSDQVRELDGSGFDLMISVSKYFF